MSAKHTLLKLGQAARDSDARRAELARLWKERRRDSEPEPEGDNALQAAIRELCEWESYPGFWGIKDASFSDYSGGFLERSNSAVLEEKFPTLVETYGGGHGTVWTGIPHDHMQFVSVAEAEALLDILRGLGDYPVVDEDHYSTMEHEAKMKEWDENGRNELRKHLISEYEGKPLAVLGAVYAPDELWETWFREGDLYDQMHDENGSVYFDVERAARSITQGDLEEVAESDPKLSRATFQAFQRDIPAILKLVQETVGPDPVARLEQLSDEHLFALFEHLAEKVDEGHLWDVSDERKADPVEGLTLRADAVREIAYLLSEERVKETQPEMPGQLKLPLESRARRLVGAVLEGFKEARAKLLNAGADHEVLDALLASFKDLKRRQMLTPEELDIDRYASIEELHDVVTAAAARTRSPKAKVRQFQVVPDSVVVHEDDTVVIVVPHSYEAAKHYGKGTKWCVAAEDYPGHWKTYRDDLAKHYLFLFKDRSSRDPYYKMALTRWPGGRYDGRDAEDNEVAEADWEHLSGFDPKRFKPFTHTEVLPHEQWKVARQGKMPFIEFLKVVEPAAWDAIGERVASLKKQWLTANKPKHPEASEAELEPLWRELWRETRREALEDPSDTEFLNLLAHYVNLYESRCRAAALVAQLLEA